ncbi:MAG: FMN-binding negative transcriptional regulator [Pseudoalteromonas distincta]
MYLPEHFAEDRPEQLHALMRAYPLAALVMLTDAGLDANHIPFELLAEQGAHGVLQGHIARANPLVQQITDGAPVLVIFQGPHGYISPNWYPSKHETHRQVPTWNYQVVHAHGRIRLRDDERFVRGLVARLTREHEAQAEPERPWKMTDSSPDYISEMLAKIVGIEIDIERLVGKFKLSQNKVVADVAGVVEALDERGQQTLADSMRGLMEPAKQ